MSLDTGRPPSIEEEVEEVTSSPRHRDEDQQPQQEQAEPQQTGLVQGLYEGLRRQLSPFASERDGHVRQDACDRVDRQVSVESFGPSNLHLTEMRPRRASLRFNRLPTGVEKKVKDLHQALEALLLHNPGSRASNVEYCVRSTCHVLHHLCKTAELEAGRDSVFASEASSHAPGSREHSHTQQGARGEATNRFIIALGEPTSLAPEADASPARMSADENEGSEAGRCASKGSVKNSPEAPRLPGGLTLETQETIWLNEPSADIGSRRRSFQLLAEESACPDGLELRTSSNACYIHPERPFRLGWDFTSMLLILVLSVVIPLEVCFYWDGDSPVLLSVFADILDIFFMIDLVLNFFTAFHEGHGISGRLVTDFKGIAKHYAKGWLWIDIVASFPWLRVMKLLGADDDQASSTTDSLGMLKVLRYAKVARMMKVLRVLKLGSLIQLVEEKLVAAQSMTVAFQLLKMTVAMLIISHNVACGWYAVAIFASEPNTWLRAQGLEGAEEWRQYVASFYFAITTGTTVGYGDIHPENSVEQIVTVFVLVLSVAYIGQFLGRVSQMVSSLRAIENQTSQAKRSAMLFMKKRAVPKELQFKVLRYIEHVFETDAVTALDEKVMNMLSDSLKNQLALSVTGNVLKKFPLFEHAEESFLTALCQVCRTERAGVGDVMVTEEQAAHEMFWVVRGEVAVMRRNRQVGGLRTGDWFGELSLFLPGAVRKATVRCETNCEFVVLHHDQFQKTIEEFPMVRREYEKITSDLRKGCPPGAWRGVQMESNSPRNEGKARV